VTLHISHWGHLRTAVLKCRFGCVPQNEISLFNYEPSKVIHMNWNKSIQNICRCLLNLATIYADVKFTNIPLLKLFT
jgi:hypothetical protein